MSKELVLRIYDESITVGEHRALRQAATDAAKGGAVTYLDVPEGRAAIVPEEAARWWEAYVAELCPLCAAGRHFQCWRYAGQACSCINAAVHNEFEMARSIHAGLLKRRHV
jgi:hypothetical protein